MNELSQLRVNHLSEFQICFSVFIQPSSDSFMMYRA